MDPAELAGRIDHTLLKAEADRAAVDLICEEAIEHGFASACVNGRFARHVARRLEGSGVRTCSVVGFPLGAMETSVKAAEAARACEDGADEIDFVASIPVLMAQNLDEAAEEWSGIVRAARGVRADAVVKVIIESAALMADVSDEEADARICLACEAARRAGCDFVKTSTGFHSAGGATKQAVEMMRRHGAGLQVKASGGIRTTADAELMVAAGADRLGCSASIAIVQGLDAGSAAY